MKARAKTSALDSDPTGESPQSQSPGDAWSLRAEDSNLEDDHDGEDNSVIDHNDKEVESQKRPSKRPRRQQVNTLDEDDGFEHILDELDMGRRTTTRLKQNGIHCIDGLLNAGQAHENDSDPFDGIQDHQKDVLEKATEFIENLKGRHGDRFDPKEHFTAKSFDAFGKHRELDTQHSMFSCGLLGITHGERNNSAGKRTLQELVRKNVIPKLLDREVKKIIQHVMTNELKKSCGNFKYKELLHSCARKFVQWATQREESCQGSTIWLMGKTQAGKSSAKGVVQAFAQRLKVPMVVVTKGLPESKSLYRKLKAFVQGTGAESTVVCATKVDDRKHSEHEIDMAFEGGGVLVLNDTKPQVEKAIRHINTYRSRKGETQQRPFVLIVDECDAMLRTPERHQVFEQAFMRLLDLEPCILLNVSATLLPNMIESAYDEDMDEVEFFVMDPGESYVDLEDMEPIEKDGKPLWLRHGILKHTNPIPYTSDEVLHLYDEAVEDSESGKMGVLVLGCTNPRVEARGGVREMGEMIQQRYMDDGKHIIVILFVGRGICVKHEATDEEWEMRDEIQIDQVIDKLDDDYGRRTPIFVFGFSKMRRGISFRSKHRVPTHYVVLLGKAHKAMNVIQAMGRATGRNKNILKENGFETVKYLGPAEDMEMSIAYYKHQAGFFARSKDKKSFSDALFGGPNDKLPDDENFARHTSRELGNIKGHRAEFRKLANFKKRSEKLSDTEMELKEKYKDDKNMQGLFFVLLDLHSRGKPFCGADIADAFNEIYKEDSRKKMKRNEIHKEMRDVLARSTIVEAKAAKKPAEREFKVNNENILRKLVNEKLALTQADIRDGYTFDDRIRAGNGRK